jgi:hypothetical protein
MIGQSLLMVHHLPTMILHRLIHWNYFSLVVVVLLPPPFDFNVFYGRK